MMARVSEADRLRACRETFVFAMEHGLSMQEARRTLVQRRWAAVDARFAARRKAVQPATDSTPYDAAPWMMRD